MRRRSQSGQAIVLGAFAMLALLVLSALVLTSGAAYWERQHLQQLADSAALAAANEVGGGCGTIGSRPVVIADHVIASQLGNSNALGIAGSSCTAPYVGTNGYQDRLLGSSVASRITYPYAGSDAEIEVKLTGTMPVALPGLLGSSSADITARAVAKFNASSLPGSFAVYSAEGINCNGSSGAAIKVEGSVYSGGVIASGCSIYASAIRNGLGGSYTDYGDILVYPAGQGWTQGGGSCAPGSVTGNALCADGLEVSGNKSANVACAPAAPLYAGITDYMDPSQGTGTFNPNPCVGGRTPAVVPAPNLLEFLPPEPNLDVKAQRTINSTSPQACDSGRPQGSLGTPDYVPSRPVYVKGRPFTLTQPLSPGVTTSLAVTALPDPLTKMTGNGTPSASDVLELTLSSDAVGQPLNGITLRQSASAGDTTLQVNSFNTTLDFPAGTVVTPTYALPIGRVAAGSFDVPQPTGPDAEGLYSIHPGCYGWLDISRVHAFYTPPGGTRPIPGAILLPGFYYFNGASEPPDPYSGGAGGLCLNNTGKLLGSDITLEFVNGTSFSTADCSSLPNSAGSAPGFGSAAQMFAAPDETSSWCKDPTSPQPPSCQGLLIWAPPYKYQPPSGGTALCQNQGTFYVKGTTSQDYLGGTIYWPGQPQQSAYAPCTPPPTSSSAMNSPGCQYTANSTSEIIGQLICYAIDVQGGSGGSSLGITLAGAHNNNAPSEAGLIE